MPPAGIEPAHARRGLPLPGLSHQSEPVGLSARLAARADVELAQDRADVVVDRLLGQDQPRRRSRRCAARRATQREHLELARASGPPGSAASRRGSARQAARAALAQAARDDRRRRPRAQRLQLLERLPQRLVRRRRRRARARPRTGSPARRQSSAARAHSPASCERVRLRDASRESARRARRAGASRRARPTTHGAPRSRASGERGLGRRRARPRGRRSSHAASALRGRDRPRRVQLAGRLGQRQASSSAGLHVRGRRAAPGRGRAPASAPIRGRSTCGGRAGRVGGGVGRVRPAAPVELEARAAGEQVEPSSSRPRSVQYSSAGVEVPAREVDSGGRRPRLPDEVQRTPAPACSSSPARCASSRLRSSFAGASAPVQLADADRDQRVDGDLGCRRGARRARAPASPGRPPRASSTRPCRGSREVA